MRLAYLAMSLVVASCAPRDSPDLVSTLSPRDAASGETAILASSLLKIPREDYPTLVEKACRGDVDSIRQVQLVTGHGDGASSFGQTLTIQKVLQTAGDKPFAEALTMQTRQVILAHAKFRNPRFSVHIDSKRFPESNRIIIEAEQGEGQSLPSRR